jgi:hypothetical protein
MDEFTGKRARALQLLQQTGMRRSSYLPPAVRLLWRMGFQTPLPHLTPFTPVALATGLSFGALWGLLMGLFGFLTDGAGTRYLLFASGLAGLLFGLMMASYYARGRRRHNLPLWSQLEP